MGEGLSDWFWSMWAPWLVTALPFAGMYARLIRGTWAEVDQEDYLRTARAKGLDDRGILRHQIRATVVPVLTQLGSNLTWLISGAVVVERIFDIPGLGNLVFTTSFVGDFPVLLGVTLVGSIAIIAIHFIVDIAYMYADPRIVLPERAVDI
jgi:peptide/nickel transport system permease protein